MFLEVDEDVSLKDLSKKIWKSRKIVRTHAGQRMQERFGIVLRADDEEGIKVLLRTLLASNATKSAHAVVLEEQYRNARRARYVVRFKGEWVPLVYDRQYDQIVTVLPIEVLNEFGFVPPREATMLDRFVGWLSGRKVEEYI